jgi:hypothetical protein
VRRRPARFLRGRPCSTLCDRAARPTREQIAVEPCNFAHGRSQALNWDDIRHALAIGEAGSLAGAARALGVNHTTVLRRLDALEAELCWRRRATWRRVPTRSSAACSAATAS